MVPKGDAGELGGAQPVTETPSLETAAELIPEEQTAEAELRQSWLRRKLGKAATALKNMMPGGSPGYIEPLFPIDAPSPSERLTRRQFLVRSRNTITGVAVAATAAHLGLTASIINDNFAAVSNVEDQLWPYNEPVFRFLGNETYADEDEIAIYLPGFGDMQSGPEAHDWWQTSEVPKLKTGYIEYSNEATTIEKMVQLIHERVDVSKLKSITLVGRSIGGLYALEVAAQLGVPVKCLMLISSPSTLSNGEFGWLGGVVDKLPDSEGAAISAKFFVNAWRDIEHHGFDPAENMARAWHETMSGAKSEALKQEIHVANGIHIEDDGFIARLSKVFIPGFTRVAYAATHNPATDETVNVVDSASGFRKLCQKLRVTYQQFGVRYDGHANVVATAQDTRGWIQDATSPMRILASK